ncbi:hypothetical protein C0995_013023 [Termitomyces sp. Mi166|nr:hypothetical protein C0995_013023 [Termitomyces sp. Mi166\
MVEWKTLVYHTGTTPWKIPTGAEGYCPLKEPRPVFGHKINDVWKDLGPKVCQLRDSKEVLWTAIDIVRFKADEGPVGPVVLWIGVVPETLSDEDARTSANGCLGLLKEFGITDVEVEFRGSIVTRSASPSLLKPVSNLHPTVDVCGPPTAVLGSSIAAEATPHAEGTMSESDQQDLDKTFLTYHNVLLGTRRVKSSSNLKVRIDRHGISVELYGRQIETLKKMTASEDEEEVAQAKRELENTQLLLKRANGVIEALVKFYDEVTRDWSDPNQRVLGHVVRSARKGLLRTAPLSHSIGPRSRRPLSFKGNGMDLGASCFILPRPSWPIVLSRDGDSGRPVHRHDVSPFRRQLQVSRGPPPSASGHYDRYATSSGSSLVSRRMGSRTPALTRRLPRHTQASTYYLCV